MVVRRLGGNTFSRPGTADRLSIPVPPIPTLRSSRRCGSIASRNYGAGCVGKPRSRGGASMTITLALRPGLEQRVLARAAASGVSPEAYLLSVIEEAAPASPPELTTLEQFEAALDAFSEGTEALPVLPPEV